MSQLREQFEKEKRQTELLHREELQKILRKKEIELKTTLQTCEEDLKKSIKKSEDDHEREVEQQMRTERFEI